MNASSYAVREVALASLLDLLSKSSHSQPKGKVLLLKEILIFLRKKSDAD